MTEATRGFQREFARIREQTQRGTASLSIAYYMLYYLINCFNGDFRIRPAVLDLGCAIGNFSYPIRASNLHYDLWPVDIEIDHLRQAMENWEAAHLEDYLLVEASGLDLPFRNRCFHFSVCEDVYISVPDWQGIHRELLRTTDQILIVSSRFTKTLPTLDCMDQAYQVTQYSADRFPLNVINPDTFVSWSCDLFPARSIHVLQYAKDRKPSAGMVMPDAYAKEYTEQVFIFVMNPRLIPLTEMLLDRVVKQGKVDHAEVCQS